MVWSRFLYQVPKKIIKKRIKYDGVKFAYSSRGYSNFKITAHNNLDKFNKGGNSSDAVP